MMPTDPVVLRDYHAQPLTPRFSCSTFVAMAWALTAHRLIIRSLRRNGSTATVIAPPRWLPSGARRGVDAALRRLEPTCLERSLVMQTWLDSQGVFADVVVGVDARSEFAAHAWLDFETTSALTDQFSIIHRIAPPGYHSNPGDNPAEDD